VLPCDVSDPASMDAVFAGRVRGCRPHCEHAHESPAGGSAAQGA
jgi:hypothetical protein